MFLVAVGAATAQRLYAQRQQSSDARLMEQVGTFPSLVRTEYCKMGNTEGPSLFTGSLGVSITYKLSHPLGLGTD